MTTSMRSRPSQNDTQTEDNRPDDCETTSFEDEDLTHVLECMIPEEAQDNDDKVSIGDVMDNLESRGFGPLLFAPALIAVMPTGGIPGVPTVCGALIVILSVQMLMGKEHPWMPNFVNKISFEEEKLEKGVKYASKVTEKIDKVTRPRIEKLSSSTGKKAVALVCIVAGVSMMPLELVPFAVMIPALSVVLFAIGLISKDGYVLIGAFLLNLATLYFVFNKAVGMIGGGG